VPSITDTNIADRLLVQRVLHGDRGAFGIIIKDTEKLVTHIVFDMISNVEERKDIAQDIYIKVYQKLSSFKFQSKLSTWIGQISYNTCIDHLRKRKFVLLDTKFEETEAGNENDMLDILNNRAGLTSGSADTFVIQKTLSGILKTEVEKLPVIFKTLITLYHNEELSYDEIGEITALPAGTVKSYLFRARKELKNNLLRHYKKEELW
jgi:RNA polymerase sigma factor (sigma-70 family)